MPYSKKDIKIINTKVAHQGFVNLEVIDLQFKLFNGEWGPIVTREVLKRRNAVGVLLFDPNKDLLILLEQFRIGALTDHISPWQIEVMAGMIEFDEKIEDTIYREAHEEARAEIFALEAITKYWVSPGASDEYVHLFCAAVDSEKIPEFGGNKQENEDIRLVKVPLKETLDEIYGYNMNNAMTIICLGWMKENYVRLKKNWEKLI